MKVLNVRNAIEALGQGIRLIKNEGEHIDSRAGMTIELPYPVTTIYRRPWERVLISKVRDANPFFHLMESMWILAGRWDVNFLSEFNKRISEYSDDGLSFNAPYGYRLRNGDKGLDQLSEIIKLLKVEPNTRQAVCQLWHESDLTRKTKDKACNIAIGFRVRNDKLCMTVYNRSNDMIWGAYGANVVQFSIIQEYVAANLGLQLGAYTQVSNSYHVYTENAGGAVWDSLKNEYDGYAAIYDEAIHNTVFMQLHDIRSFNYDLYEFFSIYDKFGIEKLGEYHWLSEYFNKLVAPMLCVYLVHKKHGPEKALKYSSSILADDWKLACEDWLTNRMEARK